MPDRSTVARPDLTKKQFLFLARKLGVFSKRTLLDVSVDGAWITDALRMNGAIFGIADQALDNLPEVVSVGSPAGSIQTAAHSMSRVLIRSSAVFQSNEVLPETSIALANLLSCLKPKGRLIIPVAAVDGEEHALWKERLAGFPGRLTHRFYKTGFFDYLQLTFLLRGIHQIPVLEFSLDKKPISRLEWHRYAREVVMQRMQKPSTAA